MEATVVKKGEKEHALMLDGHELGVSKSDCDARFHMHAINAALVAEFNRGLVSTLQNVEGVEQTRIMSKEECDALRAYWRGHEDGFHDRD